MKVPDQWTAKLMVVCGKLAMQRRTLIPVTLEILAGINPHSSIAEWQGKKYELAGSALSKDYDDVERRSGPESVRLSDCVRPFTREEKLLVYAALCTLDDGCVPSLGWCGQRAAEELKMQHQVEFVTRR